MRGDQRGRELGYPTANLRTRPARAVPADGIYAGWPVLRRGERLPAAISHRHQPDVRGPERTVEAYVLDFDGDLYGVRVAVDFVERLRGTVKFDSVDACSSRWAATWSRPATCWLRRPACR